MDNEKYINVLAGCVDISTKDRPIIGTDSLASCVGFVLYDREAMKAIVGHCFPDIAYDKASYTNIYYSICEILLNNELLSHKFELIFVEGAYTTDRVMEAIYKLLTNLPIVITEIKSDKTIKNASSAFSDIDNSILPNDIAASRCFAFDSISGEFVTKQMNFKFKKI